MKTRFYISLETSQENSDKVRAIAERSGAVAERVSDKGVTVSIPTANCLGFRSELRAANVEWIVDDVD